MIEEFDSEDYYHFRGEEDIKTDIEDSVLDYLESSSILKFYKNGYGFVVVEQCDKYFAASLTNNDIIKLIKELQELVDV